MYASVHTGRAWACACACPESVREVLLTADDIGACTKPAIQIVIWNLVAN